jgi:bacterioferritin
MDEPNVRTLNELVQGEHMAVQAYESVLPALQEETRKEISGIIRDHKQHALEISDRIVTLGGIPDESTGMPGMMSQAKLKAESMVRNEKSLLQKLYDGEDQGIGVVEKIIKGDLDETSREMVDKILRTDHDHLKNLQQLIDLKN